MLDSGASIRLKSSGGGATGLLLCLTTQAASLILNGGELDAGDDMLSVVCSTINSVTNTTNTAVINGGPG